jgi:acyl-[acyl-carrier-protein] desaturase
MDDASLLNELECVAERLLERHLDGAKEWFPHEVVPWSRGRDFEPEEEWDPNEVRMSDAVRSALFVNLLTEDNLPYYSMALNRMFGGDGPWGTWARRWTAEEGRHSIVIRDYLTVTRSIDPWALERGRMAQVSLGQVPAPATSHEAFVYVAIQELATRIAHHNTGRLLDDPAAHSVMKRVVNDENRHHIFYRDLVQAAIEIDPSEMVIAIESQVRSFAMPGTGIIDFDHHAREIAKAGIYDFAVHHDQILQPVINRQWKVGSIEGLSPEAEKARDRLFKYIDRVGKAGRRFTARRSEAETETETETEATEPEATEPEATEPDQLANVG